MHLTNSRKVYKFLSLTPPTIAKHRCRFQYLYVNLTDKYDADFISACIISERCTYPEKIEDKNDENHSQMKTWSSLCGLCFLNHQKYSFEKNYLADLLTTLFKIH